LGATRGTVAVSALSSLTDSVTQNAIDDSASVADAGVSAVIGAVTGDPIAKTVSKVTNNFRNQAKGKHGEAITRANEGMKGFVDAGPISVPIGNNRTSTLTIVSRTFLHEIQMLLNQNLIHQN